MKSYYWFIILLVTKLYSVEITLGVSAFPDASINILARSTNQTQVLRQLYEPPFVLTDTAKLIAPYFSKWEVQDNGIAYEFILKSDIQFSDGQPILANHIVEALQRTNSSGIKLLPEMKSISINGQKIKVTLKSSSFTLPDKLSDLGFAIIYKKNKTDLPIGSGAFRLQNPSANNLTMIRNKYHRDYAEGDIEKIKVKLLERPIYTLTELSKEKIDFFPLIQIKQEDDTPPSEFNRVIFPSNRVNILVINIKNALVRQIVSACIDPSKLLSIPYFEKISVPYTSFIPTGLENYSLDDGLRSNFNSKKCAELGQKMKQKFNLRWINLYSDQPSSTYISSMIQALNKQMHNISITVNNLTLTEAQQAVASGNFNFFLCGVGSPYPLAEGIMSDFVFNPGDKNKLLSFEDANIKKYYDDYIHSNGQQHVDAINNFVRHIISAGFVIPVARRIDVFYIPKHWRQLTMISAMNGNFYLGRVKIEKNTK